MWGVIEWWVHHHVEMDDNLFGIKIFWVDRVAKLMQLVGGFTVLLDLVDIAKIQKGVKELEAEFPWRSIWTAPPLLRRLRLRAGISRRISSLSYDVSEEIVDESGGRRYTGLDTVHGKPIYVYNRTKRNPKFNPEVSRKYKRRRELLNRALGRRPVSTVLLVWTYLPLYTVAVISTILLHNKMYVPWLFGLAGTFAIAIFLDVVYLTLIAIVVRTPLLLFNILLVQPVAIMLGPRNLREIIIVICFLMLIAGSLVDIVLS